MQNDHYPLQTRQTQLKFLPLFPSTCYSAVHGRATNQRGGGVVVFLDIPVLPALLDSARRLKLWNYDYANDFPSRL